MATISLYASKVNGMPGMIRDVKSSVMDLKTEIFSLRVKSLTVNKSICDMDDVISSITAATQVQEDKVEALETFRKNSEQFISDTARVDGNVADRVNENKDDFYDKYYYLKPDCEKSGWEKFCDGCAKAGEWCKENWKSLVKIVVAVVIIVALGIATVFTGGTLGVIIAGAFWGALIGGAMGGIMGGITSAINGGSFLEGFADGLLSGTVSGAITGAACAALGLAGQAVGNGIKCMSNLGKAIKVTSKVTSVLSGIMDGFDTVAMAIGLFNPDSAIVKLNQKLHSSALYNFAQAGINALAIFTGAATTTMKCFVAGTLVLTASGYVAIETIRARDKVISTDPDTMKVAEKKVLDTFAHETEEVVHLTINGETITATVDHPFYVQDAGFVGAADLYIGDKLLDADGNTLLVEDMKVEKLDVPVKVYNFKVEGFHTYYVGNNRIFVHNADCLPSDKYLISTKENGDRVYARKIDGETVEITFTKADDGNYYPRFENHTHPDYQNAIKPDFEMNGVQAHDNYHMNKQVFGDANGKPDGYTWHHLEDGETMILVDTKIHSKFHHQGGAHAIRVGD